MAGTQESRYTSHELNHLSYLLRQMSHSDRYRLMLTLIQRIHEKQLTHKFLRLLNRALSKDFTYARAKIVNFHQNSNSAANSKNLNMKFLDKKLEDWVDIDSSIDKSVVVLTLMCECDSQLLYKLAQVTKAIASGYPDASSTSIGNTERFEGGKTNRGDILRVKSASRRPTRTRATTLYEPKSTAHSLNQTFMIQPGFYKDAIGAWASVDFIRTLPIYLSKQILGLLDSDSMKSSACVSRYWAQACKQVVHERNVYQKVCDDSLMLQGGAAEGVNPTYAQDIDLPIPTNTNSFDTDGAFLRDEDFPYPNFVKAYENVRTRKVIMEERNVFCGAYNVIIMMDNQDDSRVIHLDNKLIAYSNPEHEIRLLDKDSRQTTGPRMKGHAGSVKCLFLTPDGTHIISGSYDTTVRLWSLSTGQCEKIYPGHQGTVTSLDIWQNILVSGSRDKSCKVWDMTTGSLQWSLRHKSPVTAVSVGEDLVVSGDDAGIVNVWYRESGQLMKSLTAHSGTVTCIKFDRRHIVTGSRDTYALLWSTSPCHKRAITALKHQKTVLCLEMLYLRVVTGSQDGRIRIWNLLTGHCCRIIRGNSHTDPIISLHINNNHLTINTCMNVIALNFEAIEWDYSVNVVVSKPVVAQNHFNKAPMKFQPRSYIRARRLGLEGTISRPSTAIPRLEVCQQTSYLTKTSLKPPCRPKSTTTSRSTAGKTTKTDLLSTGELRLWPESGSRNSWAGDQVSMPQALESCDLQRTKQVWRAKMRSPGFLRLDPSDDINEYKVTDDEVSKLERPSSSPSRLDPRKRMPLARVHLELSTKTNIAKTNTARPKSAVSEVGHCRQSAIFQGLNIEERKTEGKILGDKKYNLIPGYLEASKTPVATPMCGLMNRPWTSAVSRPTRRHTRHAESVNSPFKDPLRLKNAFFLCTNQA